MPDVRWGLDAAAQHERLARFADAGITTFVLTAICPRDVLPGAIRALARRG
jgi:hypothetical protein